jgi:hypothetical protein
LASPSSNSVLLPPYGILSGLLFADPAAVDDPCELKVSFRSMALS